MKNLDKVKQNILDRAKKEKWTISDYENYMRNIEKRIEIYTEFVKDKDRNDILVDFLLKRTVELTEIFNFLKKN